MAKVCVTGGAGYIGSMLVPELLRRGHEVVVVDNFMYRQTSLLECVHDPTLNLVRGDARNRQTIQRAVKGCDVIIPLACIVGAPACDKDSQLARSTNLDAILLLLELRDQGQRIIFPNTNSGYGIGQDGMFCTEESPLNPVSLYGQLKVEAEKRLLEAGNAITFRLATVFGISPRMRLDLLVNDFVYRAVFDRFVVLFEPHFKRNYIHVRDVVSAFLHAIDHFDEMKDTTYNVGLSNANLSKHELCQEIQKILPSFVFQEASIGEDPDKRNYVVSNEKIEATGYRPQVSLRQGIEELVKGYQVIPPHHYSNR
ncbi:MAG: NAD(P)-dependent oxidoreductase [Patescibacteria group bacterium]